MREDSDAQHTIALDARGLADNQDAATVIRQAAGRCGDGLSVKVEAEGPRLLTALLWLEQAGLRDIEIKDGCDPGYLTLVAPGRPRPPIDPPALYALHYNEAADPVAIVEAHREWGRQFDPPPLRPAPKPGNAHRPIRVGFLSQDFRGRHPILFFLRPLLRHLDSQRFQPLLYSTAPDYEASQEMRRLAPLHSVGALSDAGIAALVRRDAIDVLIDLCGHMRGSRLPVFAQRPAPVQLTWLAYPNTSGLAAIDYRLSDAVSDPPTRPPVLDITDPVLRIEGSFLTYEPPADAPPVSPLPALSRMHVTFGVFNNPAKIAPRALDIWARILHRLPSARVLFHHGISTYHDPHGPDRRRISAGLCERGISAERYSFTGCLDFIQSLNVYAEADIALDTFPYNGATTTCESLWMGLPVVNLAGKSHVSRVTTSLLHQAGLPGLVAGSEAEYLNLAVDLASDLEGLAEFRAGVRQKLLRSRLFDHEAFARAFESAVTIALNGSLDLS